MMLAVGLETLNAGFILLTGLCVLFLVTAILVAKVFFRSGDPSANWMESHDGEDGAADPNTAVRTIESTGRRPSKNGHTNPANDEYSTPSRRFDHRNGRNVFRLEDVTKVYKSGEYQVTAVDGVSVEFFHETTAIVGPSGDGKSTLLNLLAGLDEPTSGTIYFRGRSVPYHHERSMRRYRSLMATIRQDLNLLGSLTAVQQIALPLRLLGHSKNRALAKAREFLGEVGLTDAEGNRHPRDLSGGQRQRIAIARAFAASGEVILGDEPMARLDGENRGRVTELLFQLADRMNRPVVLVTHNMELARQCDRILYCHRGRLLDEPPQSPHPRTVTAQRKKSETVDFDPLFSQGG